MAIILHLEDIKKAKTYLPLRHKAALANLMAPLCILTEQNSASTAANPLPDRCVENRMMRLQCLYGVLAGYYLGMDYQMEKLILNDEHGKRIEREINYCMSADGVDEWAASHVMNQFDRLKREKTAANTVYDLLYDFKGFEALLNGAIRDELEMRNDPALRMAQLLAMQATPEAVQDTLHTLEAYREALEEKNG